MSNNVTYHLCALQLQKLAQHKGAMSTMSPLCSHFLPSLGQNCGHVTKVCVPVLPFSYSYSVSLVERKNSCFSVFMHALNNGMVSDDSPVLCCASLHQTPVVDECNASVVRS